MVTAKEVSMEKDIFMRKLIQATMGILATMLVFIICLSFYKNTCYDGAIIIIIPECDNVEEDVLNINNEETSPLSAE